jgi:hypothetical protein
MKKGIEAVLGFNPLGHHVTRLMPAGSATRSGS